MLSTIILWFAIIIVSIAIIAGAIALYYALMLWFLMHEEEKERHGR